MCNNSFLLSINIRALINLLTLIISLTSVYGTTITCNYSEANWQGIGTYYTCFASAVVSNETTIVNVEGEHVDGRTDADVVGLSFYNQNDINRLPLNLAEFFPNLVAFDWVFGNLTRVSADDLSVFPNLEILSLYGNQLVSLADNLLSNLLRLQFVDFGNNSLGRVGQGLLSNLTELKWALFQRNPCINIVAATPDAIEELNNVFEIQCPVSPGIAINCSYADANWQGLENRYTCFATAIETDGTGIVSVNGEHLEGRTDADVEGLSFYNPPGLTRLPFNIDEYFPNIAGLDWTFGDLTTISSDDFRQMPNLSILSLYGNRLTSLDSNLLQNTPLLQFVDFGSNLIEEVGEGIFNNLNNLRWALFQRNPCIDFIAATPEAIEELTRLFGTQCSARPGLAITCEYSDANWQGIETLYTCFATAVRVDGSGIVSVSGTHLEGRNDADIAGVSFYNPLDLDRLPSNIGDFFPNLLALDWVFGNLTRVSADDLRSLSNLTILSLYGNRLTSLDSNLLQNTPLLQFVDFGRNLIEEVGEGIFNNLNNLRWALFQRNPCIDFIAATPEAIEELTRLFGTQCSARPGLAITCEYSDANWQGIETLYTCFATAVRVDGSGIVSVSGTHLEGRNDADIAGVSFYNPLDLDRLPSNIGDFFPNILALDWVFGNLTRVSADDLRSLSNLTILSLYGNRLTSLDSNLLQNTPLLQFVDFGSNLIEEVGEGIFNNLNNLRWALFQRNPCIDFIAATPEAIEELTRLFGTQCSARPGLAITCEYSEANWQGIETLYTCFATAVRVDGSGIVSVSGTHLEGRNDADIAGVSFYNPLDLDRLPSNIGDFFPNLLALDWVFGNLTRVSADDLRSLSNLTILSLYGNRLTSLDSNLLQNTPLLQFVDFGSNLIEEVGEGIFNNLNNLRWALFQRNPCIDFIAATPEAIEELTRLFGTQCSARPGLAITCEYSDANWQGIETLYTCFATAVRVDGSGIVSVSGTHLEGRTDADIAGVSFYNPLDLDRLPSNIGDFFPNILALDWVFGNLTRVSADDLRSLSNLTILSLYGNRLTSLDSNLLQNTPLLQFVDFGSNLIEEVGEGIFNNLNNLRWALFQRNPCIDFIAATPEAIEELTRLFGTQCSARPGLAITCEYSDANWQGIETLYTCFATAVRVDGSGIVSVSGTHLEGRNDADIAGVSFYNPLDLDRLPSNIGDFFPNLLALDWVFGNLTRVSADDLRSLSNLTILSLYGNRLTSLDSNLLQNTPLLQFVDFGSNLIEEVGEGIFNNLNNLRWALFQRNPCIDFIAATPEAIEELTRLFGTQCSARPGLAITCEYSDANWQGIETLYTCFATAVRVDGSGIVSVSGTHLEGRNDADIAGVSFYNPLDLDRLPSNIGDFFPNLLALDWVFGNLTRVSADDLRSLSNLTILSLHGNRLTSLDSNLLQNTPLLQFVDFGSNLIEEVGEGIFNNLNNLRWALFQRNPCIDFIAATPEAIEELTRLFGTQCSARPGLAITCEYSEANWQGIETLYTCFATAVRVDGSGIVSVSGTHLEGRNDADIAGVSFYNPLDLDRLPSNIGDFFPNLLALDWVFGNLTRVSADDLRSLSNLTILSLYGNRLTSLDSNLLQNTPLLQFVDFGSNLIEEVGEGIFNNVNNLRWALFQRNPCIDFIAATPEAMEELTRLFGTQCSARPGLAITCEYSDANWQGIETLYTCFATAVRVDGSGIVSVSGTHLEGRTDADIAGLSFYNPLDLDRLPPNIGGFFPNLLAFDWVFGNLTRVSANDLRSLSNLTILSLYGNRLTSLDSYLLQSTPLLQFVDFGNNLIEFVGEGRRNNLRWALFQRNSCIDFIAATPDTFQELEKIFISQCSGESAERLS